MNRLRNEWSRVQCSLLARNAGWMFLGRGLSVVCQGVYFIFLARLMGSTEYGIYSGAFAMVSMLSVYSTLGSPLTLLRHVSPNPKAFARYWGNVLLTTFVIGGLFVGILVMVVPYFARSYAWQMILCVAIADCLCGQLTSAGAYVFQAFEEMRVTAFLNLLVNLLRTVLAGFLLWHMHHATAREWVIASLAVSLLAAFSSLTLVTLHFGKPRFSSRLMRERIGEGFVFALSSSTECVYNDIDKALLGHYGMNTANGVYTMAYRMISIACLPLVAIHGAAFPRFFCKGSLGVRGTSEYAVRIIRRTAPIAVVSILVMLAAVPIIPYLLGKSFEESVSAVRWLCLLPLFRTLHWSAGDALAGAGYQKLRLGTQSVAAVFNFIANLFLIPHYGWLGAAWSSIATDGLLVIFNWSILLAVRSKVAGQQVEWRR